LSAIFRLIETHCNEIRAQPASFAADQPYWHKNGGSEAGLIRWQRLTRIYIATGRGQTEDGRFMTAEKIDAGEATP
jgi:hypothetical protein